MSHPPNIFISYSHQDARWLVELKTHLAPLVNNSHVSEWNDTRIKAGQEWDDAIKIALAEADVAVLLVTPAFLASNYISENELPILLGKKHLLWIAVTSSSYQLTPLGKLLCANDPSRPLDSLPKSRRAAAWVSICKKILDAATTFAVQIPTMAVVSGDGVLTQQLIRGGNMDRFILSQAIESKLTSIQLSQVVGDIPGAGNYVPHNVSPAEKIDALLTWAGSATGPGLDNIYQTILRRFAKFTLDPR